MKLIGTFTILLVVLLTSHGVFGQDKQQRRSTLGQNHAKAVTDGYGTGQSWRRMSKKEQWACIEGFVDALLLVGEDTPHMKKLLEWLNDGLFDTEQLSAMVTLYVEANPDCWNKPLHMTLWNGLNATRQKTSQ